MHNGKDWEYVKKKKKPKKNPKKTKKDKKRFPN